VAAVVAALAIVIVIKHARPSTAPPAIASDTRADTYLHDLVNADTQYVHAKLLWARAESEDSPQVKPARWADAANAFTEVVKTGKIDAGRMKESANAAVLGWKNALGIASRIKLQVADSTPGDKAPMPDAARKMLAAIDAYIALGKDANDDALIRIKFLAANTYRRYDDVEKAIPIFQDILDHHREHETAEYCVNLLLDTYNRLGRYDEMLALVDTLLADTRFLQDKPDLRGTLDAIRIKSKSKSLRK
jgi:tetratricopeptide (TPR) repeat protein